MASYSTDGWGSSGHYTVEHPCPGCGRDECDNEHCGTWCWCCGLTGAPCTNPDCEAEKEAEAERMEARLREVAL